MYIQQLFGVKNRFIYVSEAILHVSDAVYTVINYIHIHTSEHMYTDICMVGKTKLTNIYMYISETPKRCYVVPLMSHSESYES